jgi:hypothetical protein
VRLRRARASGAFALLALVVAGLAAPPASAERPLPAAREPADPAIAAALKQVSAARIQATIARLVGFGTRASLSAQDEASVAAGHGVGAARDWIRSELERYSTDCGGCLEVSLDAFLQPAAERVPEPTTMTNVYALLRGTDPAAADRIMLVTGHYDSRNSDPLNATADAPGANDDASGTAVSLECARVLSRLRFPASILFLTVAGEEQGLFGSAHFARLARERQWKIEAVLNNDIVGGDRSPGQDAHVVRVFSEGIPAQADETALRRLRLLGGESDSGSRELARYIAETDAVYRSGAQPQLIFRLDRYLRGGDHESFNEQGFSAVRLTEFHENFARQHQDVRTENGIDYGDRIAYVNFDYIARVARLNAATLASLAAAPPAPTSVRLAAAQLENDSSLSWEASPGASGYELLWRPTDSPQWAHVQAVGAATQVTVPVPKDNVIFGVRALDRAGHRSLTVVPLPAR